MFLSPDNTMNWYEADDYCQGLGRHLVSIHSDDDMDAVADLCGSYYCWIGLTSADGSNDYYEWTDGSATNYGLNETDGSPFTGESPWTGDEPNSAWEDCIEFRSSGYWNDLGCTSTGRYAVCKGAPTTAPTADPTRDPTSEPTYDTDGRAVISWVCDDISELYISRDRRSSWTLIGSTTSWADVETEWIENIDPQYDIIRVYCYNSGGGYGGFMAMVTYEFEEYL